MGSLEIEEKGGGARQAILISIYICLQRRDVRMYHNQGGMSALPPSKHLAHTCMGLSFFFVHTAI